MKRLSALLAIHALAAAPLLANPIYVPPPPAASSDVRALIVVLSLYAEAVCVAFLARRQRFVRDTFLWFAVTLLTFAGMIVAPLSLFELRVRTFSDTHSQAVILLECMVVLVEALILWLIWIRPSGLSIFRSFAIAVVGNAVSYGLSIALFYRAFSPGDG